jgi:hypothetical protein
MAKNSTSFKPANQAALKHGTRSRVAVEKRATEIRAELGALLTQHLDIARSDLPLVDVAVDVATKLKLMNEYFARTSGGSLIDTRGKVRGAADAYLQLLRLTISIFDRLGIGPAARAKILDSAPPTTSLASQLAARRETKLLEAHE